MGPRGEVGTVGLVQPPEDEERAAELPLVVEVREEEEAREELRDERASK